MYPYLNKHHMDKASKNPQKKSPFNSATLPAVNLATEDYAVFAVVLIVSTGIGLFHSLSIFLQRNREGEDDYFNGGR